MLFFFILFLTFSGSVSAVTADELKIQIENIIKQLNQLQSQVQSIQAQSAQNVQSSSNAQKITCPNLTYNLYFGLTNSETENQISELQKFLAQDPLIYPEAKITGYFGPATERAVKRYQVKYGIVSSGSPETTGYGAVGPKTREKMREGCPAQTQTQTQSATSREVPVLDTTAPSQVSNLSAKFTGSSVDLIWSAASDNAGIKEYLAYIWDNWSQWILIGQTSNLNYSDKTQRTPDTYYYAVVAKDQAGNTAEIINWVRADIDPVVPAVKVDSVVEAAAYPGDSVTIRGSGFTRDNTVTFRIYDVSYLDPQVVSSLPSSENGTVINLNVPRVTGLGNGARSAVFVKNSNGESNSLVFTFLAKEATSTTAATPSTDITPPGLVGNLTAKYASGSVDLTWSAATDNVGVKQYRAYIWDNVSSWNLVGITQTLSYSDKTQRLPSTYYYQVEAEDQAGNVSNNAAYNYWVSVVITAPVQQQTIQNPQISSICPQSAYFGQQLAIYGANFSNNNKVFFVGTGQRVENLPSYNNGATLILNVPDLGDNSFQMKIFVKNANANIDSNQVDFNYLGHGYGYSSCSAQTQTQVQQQTQQQQAADSAPAGEIIIYGGAQRMKDGDTIEPSRNNLKITVRGYDNKDVESIWAYFEGQWHNYNCAGAQTTCEYSWTTSATYWSADAICGDHDNYYCFTYRGYVYDSSGQGFAPSSVSLRLRYRQ